MKKLPLFLVLAVTLNISAQSTTYFAKPLELNSVPASSSKSDSVLVRGVDKIVKYVPRSEFTGGGGSQDLQQTLNNGYSVENTPIWINRTAGWFQDGFRLTSPLQYTSLQDGYFRIYKYDGSGDTSYSNGGIGYTKDSLNLNLVFPTPVLPNLSVPLVTSINGEHADEFGNIDISGGGTTTPVSATESGIVNNIPLQELGGVDKLINGVRIGKGSGSGVENLTVGENSFNSATTASYITAIGYNALYSNTSGSDNTAVGSSALLFNTTGFSNTSVGSGSSWFNGTGSHNTAIGQSAMYSNVAGSFNTAIGDGALYYTTGTAGSAVYGAQITAIGAGSMAYNTTGNGTALGAFSLYKQTTAVDNIAIGVQSASGITTGSRNTIIAGTGFIALGGGITTGNNNLIVAQNNGNTTGITTGSNNTIIGKVSGLPSATMNLVVIADGQGSVRLKSDVTEGTILPSQTVAMINADTSGKTILTKEYLNKTYTVATLPVISTGVGFAIVTDAVTPTYMNTVTGGGTVVTPVFYNGTNWVAH